MGNWFRRHRAEYGPDWDAIAAHIKTLAGWRCEACDAPHGTPGRVLTVHHLDSTPANCGDENLVALCQVCHLRAHGLRPRPATKAECIARLRRRHELEIGQLCMALLVSSN